MKVRISREEIIKKANWKHPNFGIFASFLSGLTNEEDDLILEGEVVEEPHSGIPCQEYKDRGTCSHTQCNLPQLPEELPVYKYIFNDTKGELGDTKRDAINAIIRYLKALETNS